MPGLLLESSENVVVLRVKFDFILVDVVKEIVRTKNLGDLDKLVRVAVAVEERFLAEDHGRKHGSETPHVKTVVVFLEIDQQLRTLEVARRHADIVLGAGMVEFGQTPINKTQL